MLIRTKHFTLYYGRDFSQDLPNMLGIWFWPRQRHTFWEQHNLPAYLAWFTISWEWLPRPIWVDHEYRIPAKADRSHIPASLWTGRKHSILRWIWPHHISFQPMEPS